MRMSSKALSAAGAAALVTGLVSAAGWAQVSGSPDCEDVEGTLTGAFTGELSTAGSIDSNDKLLQSATTSFSGDGLATSAGLDDSLVPASTASYTGLITISTPNGDVVMRDVGIFDTDVAGGDGEFVSRARVTSGTGVFDGASGILFFHGDTAEDFSFVAQFDGTICVAETD